MLCTLKKKKKLLDGPGMNMDGGVLIRKRWARVKDGYFSKKHHMFTKIYPAISYVMFLVFFKK